MADACYRELRNDPNLAHYADHVQLATDNWLQKATSDRQYHSMCILRLLNSCIILDPVYHRLGAQFVNLHTIDGAGLAFGTDPQYCYVSGPGSERILVQYEGGNAYLDRPQTSLRNPGFHYSDPYMDIRGGVAGGVVNLSYPSSKNIYQTSNGFFPSHRVVGGSSVWNYQPLAANYDSFQLANGDYLVNYTHRLEIDFEFRTLLLEIPGTDWLARPANNALAQRYIAIRNGGVNLNQPSLMLFKDLGRFNNVVRHGFSAATMVYIQLMDDMFHELGHSRGEVIKVANTMLSVWREERKKRRRRRH
jgi:hypothetical protein